MTGKGSKSSFGVQVMFYILICEMVTQVCLLLSHVCAVYYAFYFNLKVYL